MGHSHIFGGEASVDMEGALNVGHEDFVSQPGFGAVRNDQAKAMCRSVCLVQSNLYVFVSWMFVGTFNSCTSLVVKRALICTGYFHTLFKGPSKLQQLQRVRVGILRAPGRFEAKRLRTGVAYNPHAAWIQISKQRSQFPLT